MSDYENILEVKAGLYDVADELKALRRVLAAAALLQFTLRAHGWADDSIQEFIEVLDKEVRP